MGEGSYSGLEPKTPSEEQSWKNDSDTNKINGQARKEKPPAAAEPSYIPPPDGGWGWVVVLSSFIIHVIADGIVYSFGVFLMEFVDYFQSGRGATSWVGSLQPAVTFTVGPLSSALTNRYGCKNVTVVGALIAAAGFVLSVFAPNLYYLYVTSGIMAGLGFGLIYLPAIVCVAQYFQKKRSFATGLAVCGSGFGTFILAPITEILVHEYGWRGAMLILGGVIFNVVACGLLFRPLVAGRVQGKDGDSLSSSADNTEHERLLASGGGGGGGVEGSSAASTHAAKGKNSGISHDIEVLVTAASVDPGKCRGEGEGLLTAAEGLEIISTLQERNALPNGTAKLVSAPRNAVSSNNGCNSDDVIIINKQSPEDSGLTSAATTSPPSEVLAMSSIVQESLSYSSDADLRQLSASQCLAAPPKTDAFLFPKNDLAMMARSEGALNKFSTHQPKATVSTGDGTRLRLQPRVQRTSESATPSTLAPLTRKDIFYSGSLLNIPMYRSQPDVYIATVTGGPAHEPQGRRDLDKGGAHDDQGDGARTGGLGVSEEFRRTMRDMLSGDLLKNPVFLMFAISNFFTSIGFNMPFIFLPDRAKLSGIDEDRAALLLSVIGIANTVGRVIFGFLSDRTWVNRLMLYNTALTICGLATAFSPAVGGNYGLLVAYAAVFGIFIGVYVSLTSVVLVDLLGLEYLTNSFGLLLLFQGAATFIGPPIAGWLCDWTGSYDISFIVMGSLIAVSGSMLYFLPLVERYYSRHLPQVTIAHDMELGKHAVRDTEADCENQSLTQI